MGPVVDSAVVDVAGWLDDAFAWYAEQVVVVEHEDYAEDVALRTHGVTLGLDGTVHTVDLAFELSDRDGSDTVEAPDLGGAAAFTARIATASRHRDGWSGELGQLELRLGDRGVPRGPRGVFHQPGEELVEQWGETAVAFSRDAADDRQLLGGSRVTSPFPADVTYRRCAERPRSVLPMWWPAVPMVVVPVAGWVDAFVKPDGAWLAVVVSAEPFAHMRAGRLARRGAVALVPTGPETQLLHPAGASAEAVAAFGASLSPSFVVTHVGEAKAERATSVVYAAEGWEEAALALTAEVPGGAVVEPLTWSVPTACLVVALGSSAEAAWAN